MKNTPIVLFLYNRLFDPLIQGNFWLYIRDIMDDKASGVDLHVITFENEDFPLTPEQEAQVTAWKAQGLVWTELSWHAGIGMKQKMKDFLSGFRTVFRLRRSGVRHIVTLGSVAGTYAYLYARFLGMKLFLYQYEPHSEYAVDNGMWPANSLQTKISRILEKRAARFATVVASGTKFMQERVKEIWRSRAAFVKIPTVANDKKFIFDPEIRKEMRADLGIDIKTKVLFYPGKFDGLYYGDETAWMFRWLLDEDPKLHFLIVTPHDDEEIIARFERAGVPAGSYSICHCDYVDIHRYFFAADFSIIAVPPGPSKKFISNIKVGEYLCAGMPYLITKGVSEDYIFAQENNVGVVVDDFVQSEITAAYPKIKSYLDQDPDTLRAHCREQGLGYRGFETLNPRFRKAIHILIGRETS